MARHPDQPLIYDDGTLKFKENKIVTHIIDDTGFLDDLPLMPFTVFSREDRVQLAQLIGYSLDDWTDLSYVTEDDYLIATQHGTADPTKQRELKTYHVMYLDGSQAIKRVIGGVYLWSIDEGRLVFRDGNREIIAIFNQWIYFVRDDGGNDG